jgi:hypothetical protein
VPLRIVVGPQYRDAALRTYIKVAALAQRGAGCRAKVTTLAAWLNTSTSEIERGLRDLHNPDPVDGIREVITVRKTTRDGNGESAHRTVRAFDSDTELFVWVPVRAADALPPRLLRLYAAIAYAQDRRMPLTVRELADHLRHESGSNQGEPLTERQTTRLLEELAVTGWITIHHRQGPRGRHLYEAHRAPLRAVRDAAATGDIHDGSAPGTSDGSPCEEDPTTDRPDYSPTPAMGSAVRRLPPVARGPVDNPPRGTSRSARGKGTSRAYSGGPADGSGPTLSVRAWTVLKPVRHLLDGCRPFVVRRIEAEIAAQLAAGTGMRRIAERLQRRYATTDTVRDGGRWILGAGLPRRGCGLDVCEDGVLWHTGQACQVCLDITLAAQPAATPLEEQPPPPAPAAPDQITLPPLAPPGAAVPDLTRAQRQALREAATPDSIRAAITAYGRAATGRLYGLQRVAQEINRLDDHAPDPLETP